MSNVEHFICRAKTNWTKTVKREADCTGRCCRRTVWMRSLSNGGRSLIAYTPRCLMWACVACLPVMRMSWLSLAALRVREADAVYVWRGRHGQFSAARQRSTRAKGQYIAAHSRHGYSVMITTKPISGSVACDKAAAIEVFSMTLLEHDGRREPCSTSRGWAKDAKPSSGRYEVVGVTPSRVTERRIRILKEAGGKVWMVSSDRQQSSAYLSFPSAVCDYDVSRAVMIAIGARPKEQERESRSSPPTWAT